MSEVHVLLNAASRRNELSTRPVENEEWKGHAFSLDFQNEFLVAKRDGEIIVTTPDLITALEAESGNPVTADALR